jgi:hypothetical protein
MQQNAFSDEKCPISEHFLLVKGFFPKNDEKPRNHKRESG